MLKHMVAASVAASMAALAPHPAAAAAPAAAEAPAAPHWSVTVEGEGPDLILIPGLMSGRSVWDQAVAGLGGRYRVHRVHLGGFAGAPAEGNARGPILDAVVDALHAYIRAEKLDRPAVAGHSMGGLLAMILAAKHPDTFGRVLVVDALPFSSLLFGPDATAETVAPRAAAFRDSIVAMPEEAWRAQQAQTAAMLVRSEAARPRVIADSLASDRSVAARAVYEVMTRDVRPSLGAIAAPLTIVYATNDYASEAMVGPTYRTAYAGAKEARLIAVADSYHFVMYDQPERFQALLGAFLAGR